MSAWSLSFPATKMLLISDGLFFVLLLLVFAEHIWMLFMTIRRCVEQTVY